MCKEDKYMVVSKHKKLSGWLIEMEVPYMWDN